MFVSHAVGCHNQHLFLMQVLVEVVVIELVAEFILVLIES